MTQDEEILGHMRSEPANVRFADLRRICERHFGPPRNKGGSHLVFRTPWPGDPGVNIQNDRGKAKTYQVRQVLEVIDRLERRR